MPRNPRAKFGCAVALIALMLAVSALSYGVERWGRGLDYNHRPAAETFQFVFGQPPPTGVSGLRASGYGGGFSDSVVWMSADATPAGIRALLRLPPKVERLHGQQAVDAGEMMQPFAPTAARVGIYRVPRLLQSGESEVYSFSRLPSHAGWIVVDRRRGQVYVHWITT